MPHEDASNLKPVQRRLLIPVAAVMVLLALGYSFALILLQQKHHDEQLAEILAGASYSLDDDLNEHVEEMSYMLQELEHDTAVVSLLEASDREGLLRELGPVLRELEASDQVTHLYVHDAERRVILRVHHPDKFGDLVERQSTLEAERTGRPAFAMELGALGLLTLRVVMPVIRDSNCVGYLEIGKELDAILGELEERHHVQHIAMIDKRNLDKDLWEQSMLALGRKPDWERFGDHVVAHASFPEPLPDDLVRLSTQESTTDQIRYQGRTWQTLRYPLADRGLGQVGSLLLIRDVSAKRAEFLELVTSVSAGSLLILGVLLGTLYLAMRRVDHGIVEQQRALLLSRAEVQRHRDHLEELVSERTRQLEQAQSSLVDSSRRAGMAEMATGVLHNVGNILTAANTSIEMLLSRIQGSRVDGLVKTCQLLDEHAESLPEFIRDDVRGQRLPGYLHKLSDQLVHEREALLSEITSLRGAVETIKQTIAVQQSFARTTGVKESINPKDLFDDVLLMTRHAFEKHDIVVERNYEELPVQSLERGKILQILANLVENSIQALVANAGGGGRKLVVAVARVGDKLQFCVQDNGIGIARKNLASIFQYGYTTRPDGHGFGLHHSANAATELGGRLWATSEGTSRGATFYLELPLRPEKSAPASEGS